MRVGNVPIYAVDQTVRAAPALQRTPLAGRFELALHPSDAARIGLAEGDLAEVTQGARRAVVPVVLDDLLASGAARLPAAVAGSEQLGPAIGPIRIQKTTEEQSA
jgi:NADH-quinone oxidoreductase subunit G